MANDAHTDRIILTAALDQLAKWGVSNPTPQQVETAMTVVSNPTYRPR